ncbi:RNA-guided endonuclease TnpB family protein, partial [Synechococcus sp. PCC 6717]|nr:RNA-guided endonuclease TnpB family protein [Synechococcus sp. PCC 6717]
MFGCQQVLLNPNNELKGVMEFVCSEANKLTNQGIYYARQLHFKTGQWIGKHSLSYEYKTSKHFQALYSQAAQQTLISVYESFKSYRALLKLWRGGELAEKPRMPNYRKKGGLAVVSYPKQALKLVDGMIRVPLGQLVKVWFQIDSFTVPMPSNLKFEDIKELRILPRNGCFYTEFVYRLKPVQADVDPMRALGIDSGLNNWLTCVSNVGTSFIVDGLHLKSLNRWYNKQIAKLKEGKPQGFWSKRLAQLTEKRNRQIRDAVNKAARIVIDHCTRNRIGRIVFGWNPRQKDGSNLGKKTNQKFVQIPTARLKERIAQLAEQYGIEFVETEESYTSQASFVDGDFLPTFGEKPDSWKSSGKRTKQI